jgi:hypothetical protein
MSANRYKAFISYRREKSEYAILIHHLLEKLGHKDIFLDVKGIGVGKFSDRLQKSVRDADFFIPLIYPAYFNRCLKNNEINVEDWIYKEIQAAIEAKNTVIPLLFRCNSIVEVMPSALQTESPFAPLLAYEAKAIQVHDIDKTVSVLSELLKA